MIEVVAAMTTCDGRFMICRRPAGKANAGLWEFPGGKLEPNETPQAALRREIREELGMEICVGALLADAVHGRDPPVALRCGDRAWCTSAARAQRHRLDTG